MTPDDIERRLESLGQIENVSSEFSDGAKAVIIRTMYDGLFGFGRADKAQGSMSDHDLSLLFDAAYLAAFYTVDVKYIGSMQSFLSMLQERGLASAQQYHKMYKELVAARKLPEASELARQHPGPDLRVLPELHEAADLVAGEPTELLLDLDKHTLLRRRVDLHQPAQVVVVSHPLCHFSQDAMREIQGDPQLGDIFRAHASWMSPQFASFDWDVFQQWNREHPGQETSLAFTHDEWPMIDWWMTPTFYFFKSGTLITKVRGWPKGGRKPELRAALRQVGLL